MLDLQQGLGRNQLCVLSPVYRSNGSSDLDFWGEKRSKVYEEEEEDDDYGVYSQSPRLWTSASPLLPCNHLYSFPLSPKSRLQAIVDGRRELMELIQDMPESSYELSLKDIVDEQHQGLQEDEKDIVIDETSLKLKPQVQMKQKKKKKNCKTVEMSRCQSMDSGVFLLKMFFPTSLSSKRKSTAGNRLKVVSPGTSSEGSDKEWWIMRFLAMGDGKKSAKSSLIGSSSRSSSSSTGQDDSDCTPGCWPFHKKCKSRKQKRSSQL
ncbi:uncharacterized protein LOC130784330 [Actinidia eriantha]|uniref:uncharacterized protein LOC130784330 n=1 Tax=Actinidia eriantha TaxID=165200 RepID=UPI00258D473C|nr:uncharacterized protein LOC130784330 [Actinidia eriantha]